MADFRKAKYSGSLNLAPECGPVLIELDTEAKTATASLEDPESQYTLAGGGGGLDYVIPEQTITFLNGSATLQNLNASDLQDGEYIIMKNIMQNNLTIYAVGTFDATDNEIFFAPDSDVGSITVSTGVWTAEAPDNTTMIVSAIRGF